MKLENQTIVGIDPGLANLGLGAISKQNNQIVYLASQLVCTNSNSARAQRLSHIYNEVKKFLQIHKPQVLALEGQFFKPSGDISFKVGQAVGVCLLAAYQLDIVIAEFSPKQVKQTLVGTGNASKKQVMYMVQTTLKLTELESNHVGDALALAVTYLSNQKLMKMMKNA